MVKEDYARKALVTRVLDGDTFDCIIDLGFGMAMQTRIRLLGVDTPERREPMYYEATEFTSQAIDDKEVVVITEKFATGGFGRYLGVVYYTDEEGNQKCLNDELLENNLAKVYER